VKRTHRSPKSAPDLPDVARGTGTPEAYPYWFLAQIILGTRVRERRKELKMTQVDLADACKLDRTYIGGIERGERNPSLKNMAKIATALNTTVSDLMRE